MKKTIFGLLTTLAVFFISQTQLMGALNPNSLYIIGTTYSQDDPGTQRFLYTASKQGFSTDRVTCRGVGITDQITLLKEILLYLKTLKPSSSVIITPATSTIFLAGPKPILEALNKSKKNHIVFAASKGSSQPTDLFVYPKSPTSFRYLVDQAYIGNVSSLIRIMHRIINSHDYNTQHHFTDDYLSHQNNYILDYHCKIFLPLCEIKRENFLLNLVQDSVHLNSTNTNPLIVVNNQEQKDGEKLLNLIYENLF